GDSAHRSRSNSVFSGGFERGLAQLRMRGQAEVIVRRQVNDFLAVEGADRCLLIIEDAQAEMRALGLEIMELVGQVGQRIGAGGGGCHREILRVLADDCWSTSSLILVGYSKNQFAVHGFRFSDSWARVSRLD